LEGTYITYNDPDNETRKIPASTFKVLNSLIALETGVIDDDTTIIKWDSVDRLYAAWNVDHTLRTAIKYSAVWFYQELARRIGSDKMEYFVELVNYGNNDVSGPIDSFWLKGPLMISPKEQVDFLVELYHGDLPFSEWVIETVKDIMVLERSEDYILRGKTGWAMNSGNTGWFVGYIEREGNVYFFANCIQADNAGARFPEARVVIAKKILGELGYY